MAAWQDEPVHGLDEYREAVESAVRPLAPEALSWERAAGRYLAAPVAARRAAPPFTCSAMDGYAVRSADVRGPSELEVARVIYAGELPGEPLRPGEAARIFTGAPLPEGADSVVREEATEGGAGRVRFRRPAQPGENVRRAGEDVATGGEALPAGERLGPRQLALLAAVGADEVLVVRSLRVALVSTGDELVKGRTPDSNGTALRGLLAEAGALVSAVAVRDEVEAVRGAIAGGLSDADAVVTTGGVSVGERDLVPEALQRLSADVRVRGVPMKPGKPFLFALCGEKPVFGLPGSPSACLVAFEVFARPALLRMAGAGRYRRPSLRLPLAEPAEGRPGRARFLWAALTSDGRARPLGRDAAQVRGPAQADLLVQVPADCGDLAAGEAVEAWLIRG
jgi:molybdopterin molybdotransferase